MKKFFHASSLIVLLVGCTSVKKGPATCKNPTRTIEIQKQQLKSWLDNVTSFMTDGKFTLVKIKDSTYLAISDMDPSPQNVYTQLGVEEGDKIIGTESVKAEDIFSAIKVFASIASRQSECLFLLGKSDELRVVKYEAIKNTL